MDVREKAANEKRLIDANAFLKDILTAGIGKTIIEYSESDIGYMIRKRPTIDAVPVVRCRECKHRYTEDCPMYFHASYWHEGYEEYVDDDTDHTEDDYFCQEGEREEGADNEP